MLRKRGLGVLVLIALLAATSSAHALHNGQCELTSANGSSCEFKCDEGTNNVIYRCSGSICNSPPGQNIPRPAEINSCTKLETRHDVTALDVIRKIFGLGLGGLVTDFAPEP